jgi:serine/threonine protein kinase
MELADDATTGQQVDPAHYQPLTLRRALQTAGGRFPIERCVEIALVLVQGLSHLHQHGLIHRDIKPSNIIFVHGQPKLADIGLVTDAGEAKSESFDCSSGIVGPRLEGFTMTSH